MIKGGLFVRGVLIRLLFSRTYLAVYCCCYSSGCPSRQGTQFFTKALYKRRYEANEKIISWHRLPAGDLVALARMAGTGEIFSSRAYIATFNFTSILHHQQRFYRKVVFTL